VDKTKPTANRILRYDLLILAAWKRYVEGYKKEIDKRKMKISSWRLLEPRKRKLKVQVRRGKL
jgi:hypothetical protein